MGKDRREATSARRSSRRSAREVVLQARYWAESTGDSADMACRDLIRQNALADDLHTFVFDLNGKATENREWFDRLISKVSKNWALERIARVDRIILGMALAELLLMEDIPVKVSLDEALELAKKFGSEKSAAFINGILDAIARREGLLESPPQRPPERGDRT